MSQLSGDTLQRAVSRLVTHLMVFETREQALQVVLHVTAALLEGKEPDYVTSYLVSVTTLLDQADRLKKGASESGA